ncbi:hypothetical protein [Jatrophihabitans sp.]|uniref:hypothetical protein n=1 Tax=Jatrophihabitans sp. TaxID=1932789 RepID=UPI002CF96D01|nr:hypothetical protein [Jatrophihabitans sp.]
MTGSVYEVRVQGHLDRHWTGWLGDLTVTHHADGTSTLTGPVADQAALHGLLAKVRDLGIALVSITPISPTPSKEQPGPPSPARLVPS